LVPTAANAERFRRGAVYIRTASRTAANHPKQAGEDTMDDNGIRDQATDAANGLKSSVTAAMGTVTDLAGRARSAAVDAGNSIQGAAKETVKQVGDAAAKSYAQGARAGQYVSRNTAEQPLLALLIAGAIGYGIAYMIHRG
jgi:hypothetical protein